MIIIKDNQPYIVLHFFKPMELIDFLVKAKIATYASEGEASERIFYKGDRVYGLNYHGGPMSFFFKL